MRVSLRRAVLGGFSLWGCLLGACDSTTDPVWEQFNASTDQVVVEVGVAEAGPLVTATLHSSSGEVEVGAATVDPGSGPIGTEHRVEVQVQSDWEDVVQRVTLRTASGSRGEDEYEMDPDSADEGLYVTTLVSVGDEGEQRSDTFTFRLWEDVADESEGGDAQDSGG